LCPGFLVLVGFGIFGLRLLLLFGVGNP
jgi:hypothetical protein